MDTDAPKQAQAVQASRDGARAPADASRPAQSSQPSTRPNTVSTKESEATSSNQEQPQRASTDQKTDQLEAAAWAGGLEVVELGFKRHIRQLEQDISTLTRQNSRLADQLKHSRESERKYARSAELYSADLDVLCPLVKLYDDYTKGLKELVQLQAIFVQSRREDVQGRHSRIRAYDHDSQLRAEDEEIQTLTEAVEEQEAQIVEFESVRGTLVQIVRKELPPSKDGD